MSSSITEVWNQRIKTENIQDSLPEILQQVCSNLHYIINECDENNVENTDLIITYKIKHRMINKRKKLKILGGYKKIREDEQHKKCAICLEDFRKGKYKRNMPKCSHEFHKTCIDQWLYKDNKLSCPVCRKAQG